MQFNFERMISALKIMFGDKVLKLMFIKYSFSAFSKMSVYTIAMYRLAVVYTVGVSPLFCFVDYYSIAHCFQLRWW